MVKSTTKVAKTASRELAGVDKVTALLLAMGKPHADRIIKQFEDADIRAVARSAMELPEVQFERLEALAAELAAELARETPLAGSTDGAMDLLAGVMAEESLNNLMGELAGKPSKGLWQQLAGVPDAKLAQFVLAEQPQVAAYILSNLELAKASQVLGMLDVEQQTDLSTRMLALKPIGDDAAAMLAERLTQELLAVEPEEERPNTHARLGAMLNMLDREQVDKIVGRLEAQSPSDARKVKGFIFSFEDIAGLAQEDRARLFDEISSERISLALRDCDPQLTELILSSLSPRSRRFVEAEMSGNAKPQAKAIQDARRSIAGVALSLAERSLIKLSSEAPAVEGE